MHDKTIEELVHEIIAENLGVNAVTNDQDIERDLGADSLDSVFIKVGIENEFVIDISDEEADKLKTVGDVVKFVEERKALNK
jgi:acyl carrier protein